MKNKKQASRPLALLTPTEKTKVLKYYFVADAKMALASALLKHWVVSKYCGVPWRETRLSADMNGKPVYRDAAGGQPIVFNVSHQAGLVSLVAAHRHNATTGGDNSGIHLGVDIVSVSERRRHDYQTIRTGGWGKFVDTYADVFGRTEVSYLKSGLVALPAYRMLHTEDERRDFKLRAFYTLWCLREAYVKMTGEALLASWLGDLIFQNFEAPEPGTTFAQDIRQFDVASPWATTSSNVRNSKGPSS